MKSPPNILWLVPAGTAISFLGSMTGVGGGLFAVPLLHWLWRLEMKAAVATGLVLVAANALFATAAEWFHPDCALRLDLFLALTAGTLVGNQFGYALMQRVSVRRLKQAFCVLLVLAAARLFLGDHGNGVAADPESLRGLQWLYVGATGLFGGLVAPLFGVGGGLVMVPGLLFGLPSLGFAAVRAASMATSVVSAGRSAWLHHGAKRVHWPMGLALGAGAILGAVGGVEVAHRPGFESVGRPLLGAILLYVALRFAAEFRAARPDQA